MTGSFFYAKILIKYWVTTQVLVSKLTPTPSLLREFKRGEVQQIKISFYLLNRGEFR
jgi:hypothetical protein